MNDHKKLEAAWPKTLLEKDYPKAHLGDVPQSFEDIIALLRNICGPPGIFLKYCVIDILFPVAYEVDTKNYPIKDEDMINRAPIVTSDTIGTHTEKTKYGPPQKYFAVDMICLGYLASCLWGNYSLGACQTIRQYQ